MADCRGQARWNYLILIMQEFCLVDLKPANLDTLDCRAMHHTSALAWVGITSGTEGERTHSSEVHMSTIMTELARNGMCHNFDLQSN